MDRKRRREGRGRRRSWRWRPEAADSNFKRRRPAADLRLEGGAPQGGGALQLLGTFQGAGWVRSRAAQHLPQCSVVITNNEAVFANRSLLTKII